MPRSEHISDNNFEKYANDEINMLRKKDLAISNNMMISQENELLGIKKISSK